MRAEKNKISWMSLIVMLLLPVVALSAETDTFTMRNDPLENSSKIINGRANYYVGLALNDLNSKNTGCNDGQLYTELRKYFNNHSKGKLTIEIIKASSIPKRLINLENSVYKNWRISDGLGMGFDFAKKAGLSISSVIKIGEELIGTDKFEHFFGQGYYYFSSAYVKNNGVIKAIKLGVFKEKTILGGNRFANGVFSYGDLSANFNGMRFWNHLLMKHDDVLGVDHNIGPYITCTNDKWIQVKQINFEDYIDSSMDEAINCSKFPSQSTANHFVEELRTLGMNCPLDSHRIDELAIKYRSMSKWIINKDGPGAVKYFSEFKNK
jgi:hypothetical protein